MVTNNSANIATGAANTALLGQGVGSSPTFGTVPVAAGGTGVTSSKAIIQEVRTNSTSITSTATTFSPTDTIPQNTGGAQLFSISITPTNASNILKFSFSALTGISTTTRNCTYAIFQDSTANAIYAIGLDVIVSVLNIVTFDFYMAAGTTSSTTFALRFGTGNAASTVDINGTAGGRIYGGVSTAMFSVQELQV